jgi:NAD(P)-dependent dehydrogenase (short-subunit alcohol dehydrogenase family)
MAKGSEESTGAEHQRTVLITGAAGGIGAAAAEVFEWEGWRVIGIDRAADGSRSGIHSVDLSDAPAIQRFFDEIQQDTSALHALVNNAAVQITTPLLQTTPDVWDDLMAVNLRSVFLTCKLAHPLLKQVGGAIVNVSSVHAFATSQNIAAYAASKGAVLSLTRAMAIEFAPDHIRANALLPGAVDTSMLHSGMQRTQTDRASAKERLQALADRTPLGRIAEPSEIARAILFLADNERSPFMTGQSLVVDGGACGGWRCLGAPQHRVIVCRHSCP